MVVLDWVVTTELFEPDKQVCYASDEPTVGSGHSSEGKISPRLIDIGLSAGAKSSIEPPLMSFRLNNGSLRPLSPCDAARSGMRNC